MVFSSTIFLFLFLPAVLLVYYNPIFKSRTFRNVFLFLASIFFYAWGEPVFVSVMLLSIVITWMLGRFLEKAGKGRKKILVAGISFHVALLFIFKYLAFVARQMGLLLNKDLSLIEISLPIGISFFTFQLMSYLFDIYYGKAKAQKNVLYVGLYVSLFPQLIAGPIVRYEQIADEIQNRRETRGDITEGIQRFVYGLAKKVLISNFVAVIADNAFILNGSAGLSVMTAWLGAIAYALQIYFDFSGYSDMAIGMGRMFGFHFSENFNYPYIAGSVTEFWRRWHISLSTWFRDYVYIPLGGSRVKRPRWIRNLLTVWILTGIWHGANWTFLAWGGYYFTLLLIEKLTGFAEKLKRFSCWLAHIYTMAAVIIGWVIFRAEDLASALCYLGRMVGIDTLGFADSVFFNYLWNGKIVLVAAILLSAPVYPLLREKLSQRKLFSDVLEPIAVFVIFCLATLVTISSTYNPFIYFNF